eukprot:TRINITY_DN8454_c0_g1_i1.p1 TRINITY_DN8454_c0_g1~~TRINITY_DN8454_c0_g1_i1.p1  ORF type:complete len:752 (-),score=256.10 TRINITY_DN8454_c0_g1_i1:4-2259(-)
MGAQTSQAIFAPPEISYDDKLEGFAWVETKTEGHRIPVLYYPYTSRTGDPGYFTLIYSADNVGDLGSRVEWARMLCETLHINVVCYDYSGYGLNQRKPSEKHIYEDTNAVFSWVANTKSTPTDRIILMGAGFGTGPAVNVAGNLYSAWNRSTSITRSLTKKYHGLPNVDFQGVAGVILQSGITSVMELFKQSAIGGDMFENSKKIHRIRCPVLIVHGTQDEVVPISHSETLAKLVRTEYLFKFQEISGGSHWDLETEFSDDFLEELLEFISSISPEKIKTSQRNSAPVAPTAITLSPNNVIGSWLRTIGLQKYTDQFLASGFYDLMFVSKMDQHDLDLIGVEEQDRAILLEAAHNIDLDTIAAEQLPPLPESPIPDSPKIPRSPKGSIDDSAISPDNSQRSWSRRERLHSYEDIEGYYKNLMKLNPEQEDVVNKEKDKVRSQFYKAKKMMTPKNRKSWIPSFKSKKTTQLEISDPQTFAHVAHTGYDENGNLQQRGSIDPAILENLNDTLKTMGEAEVTQEEITFINTSPLFTRVLSKTNVPLEIFEQKSEDKLSVEEDPEVEELRRANLQIQQELDELTRHNEEQKKELNKMEDDLVDERQKRLQLEDVNRQLALKLDGIAQKKKKSVSTEFEESPVTPDTPSRTPQRIDNLEKRILQTRRQTFDVPEAPMDDLEEQKSQAATRRLSMSDIEVDTPTSGTDGEQYYRSLSSGSGEENPTAAIAFAIISRRLGASQSTYAEKTDEESQDKI